jgi:hypothetical protein
VTQRRAGDHLPDPGEERRLVRHGVAAKHDRAGREPLLTWLNVTADVEQI